MNLELQSAGGKQDRIRRESDRRLSCICRSSD